MKKDYVKLGDCLELMKALPKGSIDLTVTSPPYDKLRKYGGFVWDFEGVGRELYRVTKQGGVVVWVVGDSTVNGSETGSSFRQALFFMECGFKLHDTMIYQKAGCPFPETTRYYPEFEYMFVFSKGRPKTVNLIADKPNKYFGEKITGTNRNSEGTLRPSAAVKNKTGRCVKEFGVRTNIWRFNTGKNKTTRDEYAFKHPAMFPEELAQDHIRTWSNPGDIVFDPFLGSGTTAKMAILNNRHYIGFELNDEYLGISHRRLDEARQIMLGR